MHTPRTPLSEIDKSEIQQALKDLLASPALRSTQQCQHLLQYIVDHTLTGESALLRERVIGKEVFTGVLTTNLAKTRWCGYAL
jgi:hypothetical protein